MCQRDLNEFNPMQTEVRSLTVASRTHEIRPARPADAGRLASIDADVSVSPWSKRQFIRACSEDSRETHTVLVVAENGRVDGFVVFSQVLDEASIHNIAIHSGYQGRGLGHVLLKATLDQMECAGAARCLLEVRESNAVARKLYARYGFELDGVRKSYYPAQDGREDALLMSRPLEGISNERA